MTHHSIIHDSKLLEFINLASKARFRHSLSKCWYRSLRRLDRDFTPNVDLLMRFRMDLLMRFRVDQKRK